MGSGHDISLILKNIEQEYAFYQQLQIIKPHITIDSKISLQLGNESVEISFPGPTHTDDTLLVYFPGQKVIHMGDMLFNKCHPYIDWQTGSNTANWIAQLKALTGRQLIKVIPGHGPIAGPEALTELRAAVAAALEKGMTLEQMKESINLPSWKDFVSTHMRPYAIEAVYHELSK